MAQNAAMTTIDPAATTGSQLATKLTNRWADQLTQYSGTSRPTYAVAGTIWRDTSAGAVWSLKMYGGTNDIVIGTLDTINNKFVPAHSAQNVPQVDTFTGDGSDTTFDLTNTPAGVAALLVSVDGVVKTRTTDFTLSGNTVTFVAAPANAAKITVIDLSDTSVLDSAKVTTLSAISADITTVAARDANIVTVAARDADIGTVAARDADIGTVADRDADIGTVAARDADIGTVASNIALLGQAAAGVALGLFRSEFPALSLPGKAMTFFDGSSGSEFTVTRASTANTRMTEQRLMATVSANALRFTHAAATGEPVGVVIEPQITQLFTYSEELDNAAWSKTLATVTADQSAGVDGAVVLDKLIPNSGASSQRLHQSQAVTSGEWYTFSAYARADGLTEVSLGTTTHGFSGGHRVTFDLAAGTATRVLGSTAISSMVHVGGGLWRIWITIQATSTTTAFFQIFLEQAAADGVKGVMVGQAMLQHGTLPTAYIKSTSAEVTVDGDDLTLNPNSQPWHADGAQEGTWFLDVTADWLAQNVGFLNLESTAGEGFRVRNITSGDEVEGDAGALAATSKTIELHPLGSWFTAQTFTTITGDRLRVAVAFDRDDIAFCVNGGTVVTAALAQDTPVDFIDLHLGGEGTSSIGLVGTVRQLAYWPAKLADADLVTLTTLP